MKTKEHARREVGPTPQRGSKVRWSRRHWGAKQNWAEVLLAFCFGGSFREGGWDRKEAPEGGNISILRADSRYCTAETNSTL